MSTLAMLLVLTLFIVTYANPQQSEKHKAAVVKRGSPPSASSGSGHGNSHATKYKFGFGNMQPGYGFGGYGYEIPPYYGYQYPPQYGGGGYGPNFGGNGLPDFYDPYGYGGAPFWPGAN